MVKCYNTGMRRLLILTVLVLCGCGEKSAPTLQEKYSAAAADYDRAIDKLMQLQKLMKNGDARADVACQFFRFSESLMFGYHRPMHPVSVKHGRDSLERLYVRCYTDMPERIAVQKQFQLVEQLRDKTSQARTAWIESNPAVKANPSLLPFK
jgi:hypothetical protein